MIKSLLCISPSEKAGRRLNTTWLQMSIKSSSTLHRYSLYIACVGTYNPTCNAHYAHAFHTATPARISIVVAELAPVHSRRRPASGPRRGAQCCDARNQHPPGQRYCQRLKAPLLSPFDLISDFQAYSLHPKFNPPSPLPAASFFPLRTCFTSPFSFSWIHSSSLSASVEQHLDEFSGIQKTTRGPKRFHSIVCLLSRSTESDFRYLPLSPKPIFSFVSCVDRYSFARPVLAADKT